MNYEYTHCAYRMDAASQLEISKTKIFSLPSHVSVTTKVTAGLLITIPAHSGLAFTAWAIASATPALVITAAETRCTFNNMYMRSAAAHSSVKCNIKFITMAGD